MQVQTLAGVRSEKMIPNSWMCFSPLTKCHPNLRTASCDRLPSWAITDSMEPPEIYSTCLYASLAHEVKTKRTKNDTPCTA